MPLVLFTLGIFASLVISAIVVVTVVAVVAIALVASIVVAVIIIAPKIHIRNPISREETNDHKHSYNSLKTVQPKILDEWFAKKGLLL